MSKKKTKKKAAPKKAAPKKATSKKAAPKKTKAKAKLKLGFDPLAIDDQEPIDEMEHAEVGIDALIRHTTSSEDIIATAAAEGSVDEPENEEEHEEDTTPSSGEPGIDLDMGMQEEPSSADEQPIEPEPEPGPEPVAPPEIAPEPIAQPEPETEPEPVAPPVEKSGEKVAADSFRGSADDGEGDSETFFSFMLADESYAIQIELVKEDQAVKNHEQIKKFVKGTIAENAPIIPICAHKEINIEYLLAAIEEFIPSPEKNKDLPPRMFIARSFDINSPGGGPEKLVWNEKIPIPQPGPGCGIGTRRFQFRNLAQVKP